MARNGHSQEGANGADHTAEPKGFAIADRLPTNAVEGLAWAGKKWGFQAILLLLACGFIWWQASTSRKDSREAAASNLSIQLRTVEVLVELKSEFKGLRSDTQASITEQRGIRADVQANTAELREVQKSLDRHMREPRNERYATPSHSP